MCIFLNGCWRDIKGEPLENSKKSELECLMECEGEVDAMRD